MRIGQNPARQGMQAYTPNRVGVASLVYIPHLEGYYSQSLEILRVEIDSLKAHTGEPFDLFVFDNGSHRLIQEKLQEWYQAGLIDWLFLSRANLGKTGALNWILGSMPNEIICYTDSDVYFRRGWLQESLKVLEADRRVGVVSAQPCFFDVLNGQGKAYLPFVGDPARVQAYTPDARIIQEFVQGLGGGEERLQKVASQPLKVLDFGGAVKAVIGATHMQLIIRREVARKVVPLPARTGLSPEEDRVFNQRVDAEGYMHCSLLEPLVAHMGNSLEGDLAAEIKADLAGKPAAGRGDPTRPQVAADKASLAFLRKLSQRKWARRWMTRLYNALFKVLSDS